MKSIALCSILLLAVACAPVAKHKLDDARSVAAEIDMVYIDAVVPEIDADPVTTYQFPTQDPATMGAIPYLLKSLADDSLAKEAAELVAPLRDALIDYDFEKAYAARARPYFSQESPVGPKKVLFGDPRPENLEQDGVVLPTSVLLLSAKPAFAHDFSTVRVEMTAFLSIPRPGVSTGQKVDEYSNTYISEFPLPQLEKTSKKKKERVQAWLMIVDQIPAMLERGIDECLMLFGRNIQDRLVEPKKREVWWVVTEGTKTTGHLIDRMGDRVIFKTERPGAFDTFVIVYEGMLSSRMR